MVIVDRLFTCHKRRCRDIFGVGGSSAVGGLTSELVGGFFGFNGNRGIGLVVGDN